MNTFENVKFEKNIEKSIESLYILKDIFSFLSERQKLNLIIYNKNLQNKLDTTIKDYKRISTKYKEGRRNGKGKEYDKSTNIIYLNGKRNGKGIEFYSNNKIKFEGEYLNGKRIRKGKEYYYNGKLKYEGYFLNGQRNRKGKEYYYDGKI